MRRVQVCAATLAGVIILFAAPQAATGDPVLIKTGTITAGPFILSASADFSIGGDTFSLTGRLTDGGQNVCFPCTAGPQATELFWGGDMGAGSGTVDGMSYSSLFFAGTGFSVGGTALLPAAGPSTFSVTFPFAVGAGSTIWGFSDSQRTNQVFALDLTGSGTAVMIVGRPPADPPLYNTRAISFMFDASPAAVPEPTSLLLLGTGLAGLAARRYRRKQNQ